MGGEKAGFRSFWEKSKREAAIQNVTFVQVEPDGSARKPKIGGSLCKQPSIASAYTKTQERLPLEEGRRHQVYKAQKRHRHRKAQYAQSLEKEKIQLERFIREMDLESRRLSRQNNAILELLKAERVNADIDPLSAASPPESLDGGDVLISCDDVSIGSIGKFGLVTKGKGIAPDCTKSRSELRRGSHAAEVSQVARCRAILLRDVKQYESDEELEGKTWEASAELILAQM